MFTCKQLPVFHVDWQLFEEPPKCKFRCRCECRNPRRHTDSDPCPWDEVEETKKKLNLTSDAIGENP